MAKKTDQAKRKRLSQLLIEFIGEPRGWSVNRLAEELDLATPTVRAYVQATGYPEEENRIKIAELLGISYEELQAKLEDTPLRRRLSTDLLCQEIRALDRSDLRIVARVIFDRLLEEEAILDVAKLGSTNKKLD